jgi:hypothetical protein
MHTPKKKQKKNVTHKRHQLYFSINVQSFNPIEKEKQILYQESSNCTSSSSRSFDSTSYD